jgi:hypothetical protein
MRSSSILFFLVIMLCPMICAAELDRFTAYQALPVDPEEIESDQSYAMVSFMIPEGLPKIETGTAWEVVIRLRNGDTEKRLATMMCHWESLGNKMLYMMGAEAEPGTLFMLIPHTAAELEGSTGYILSHDHRMSFTFAGNMIAFGDAESTPWKYAGNLPVASKFLSAEEVRKLYAPALRDELVESDNFSMSEEFWAMLWDQQNDYGFLMQTGLVGVTAGILGTPASGAILAAISLVSRTLSTAGTQDLNHPEYSSASLRKFEFQQPLETRSSLASK